MSETLKPCPFCGGEALERMKNEAPSPLFTVFCVECECRVSPGATALHAAERWNKRTPSPVVGMSDGELIARAILATTSRSDKDGDSYVAWMEDGAEQFKAELDRRAEARKGGGK